MDKTCPKKYF